MFFRRQCGAGFPACFGLDHWPCMQGQWKIASTEKKCRASCIHNYSVCLLLHYHWHDHPRDFDLFCMLLSLLFLCGVLLALFWTMPKFAVEFHRHFLKRNKRLSNGWGFRNKWLACLWIAPVEQILYCVFHPNQPTNQPTNRNCSVGIGDTHLPFAWLHHPGSLVVSSATRWNENCHSSRNNSVLQGVVAVFGLAHCFFAIAFVAMTADSWFRPDLLGLPCM